MLLKNISIAFCVCVALTFMSTLFTRPNSSVFIPYFVLQLAGYIVIAVIGLLLNKALRIRVAASFVAGFILSYAGLIFILWNINGTKTIGSVLALHKGKEFIWFLTPIILSNVLLWMLFRRSSSAVR